MKPENLVLRCYGYQTTRDTWVLKCIDLNIAEEEKSLPEAKKSLEAAIVSYIEAVIDTDDKTSIPVLLKRKSALKDRLIYQLICLANKIHRFKTQLTFEEAVPFHISGGTLC